jgi:hypothetical protein
LKTIFDCTVRVDREATNAEEDLLQCHVETEREQLTEGEGTEAFGGRKHDRSLGQDELGQHLAAGSAGRAGGFVAIDDGAGTDADLGAVLGDGAEQSRALGADGQPVTDVFHIGSGHNFAAHKLQRGADAKARVGGIGMQGHLAGSFEQRTKIHRVFQNGTVHNLIPRTSEAKRFDLCCTLRGALKFPWYGPNRTELFLLEKADLKLPMIQPI